jgi:hypothetical protein
MKKMTIISKAWMVLTILFVATALVSCGSGSGNSGKKINAEEAMKQLASEIKELSADNWHPYVKKEFGIDAAIPSGWKFLRTSTLSLGSQNEVVLIIFETSGSEFMKAADAAKNLFDQSKAISSSEGNFLVDVDSDTYKVSKGKVFNSFEDVFTPSTLYNGVDEIGSEYWYYVGKDGVTRCITVNAKKGQMSFKFEKSLIKI